MDVQGLPVLSGDRLSSTVIFRVDASLHIGTGHVMRCLTLAHALAARGAKCQFICRNHDGNLISFIERQGFMTHALAHSRTASPNPVQISPQPAYANWLGTTQIADAVACAPILQALSPAWLVVDHYALDAEWERALSGLYRRLMVIDDLTNRLHDADLLLNQNLGANPENYIRTVPNRCTLLCGPKFALLRPEFARLRSYSLNRRLKQPLRKILISLGGVDRENVTGQVVDTLQTISLPRDCRVTVVMGPSAPWAAAIRKQVGSLTDRVRVLVGVTKMAKLMADSDLSIGAAGATSWERCCLGLPSIIAVLADNQRSAAHSLHKANAARIIPTGAHLTSELATALDELISSRNRLSQLSLCASKISDGAGCERVADSLLHVSTHNTKCVA